VERKWRVSLATLRNVFKLAYTVAGHLVTHGDLELILRPYKSKRSLDQNARYWAILAQVSASVWLLTEVPSAVGKSYENRQYSADQWHEFFKRELLGVVELPGGGVIGISTATLDVARFSDYMTRIEQWCAENGYQIGDTTCG
jgi:hypothetical protein